MLFYIRGANHSSASDARNKSDMSGKRQSGEVYVPDVYMNLLGWNESDFRHRTLAKDMRNASTEI